MQSESTESNKVVCTVTPCLQRNKLHFPQSWVSKIQCSRMVGSGQDWLSLVWRITFIEYFTICLKHQCKYNITIQYLCWSLIDPTSFFPFLSFPFLPFFPFLLLFLYPTFFPGGRGQFSHWATSEALCRLLRQWGQMTLGMIVKRTHHRCRYFRNWLIQLFVMFY